MVVKEVYLPESGEQLTDQIVMQSRWPNSPATWTHTDIISDTDKYTTRSFLSNSSSLNSFSDYFLNQ